MRIGQRLLAVMAIFAAMLLVGWPADAGTTDDGYHYSSKYHFGDISKGYVFTELAVELRYNDNTFATNGASGYGVIEKGSKAVRVQIDFVRLGRVAGGVLAEKLRPVNSGATGTSAISSTVKYSPVSESGCGVPTRLWTRVGYSVRWSDGTLSKWTELGPPTTARLCTR